MNGRPDAVAGAGAEGAGAEESQGGKKLSGAQRKKLAKEERKNKRGANKGRRFQKMRDEVELCFRVAGGKQCDFGAECVFPLPPSPILPMSAYTARMTARQVSLYTRRLCVPRRKTARYTLPVS